MFPISLSVSRPVGSFLPKKGQNVVSSQKLSTYKTIKVSKVKPYRMVREQGLQPHDIASQVICIIGFL